MRVTIPIDLSTWSFIPLTLFFNSRRGPPLLTPSLVLFPQESVQEEHGVCSGTWTLLSRSLSRYTFRVIGFVDNSYSNTIRPESVRSVTDRLWFLIVLAKNQGKNINHQETRKTGHTGKRWNKKSQEHGEHIPLTENKRHRQAGGSPFGYTLHWGYSSCEGPRGLKETQVGQWNFAPTYPPTVVSLFKHRCIIRLGFSNQKKLSTSLCKALLVEVVAIFAIAG